MSTSWIKSGELDRSTDFTSVGKRVGSIVGKKERDRVGFWAKDMFVTVE